MNIYKRKSSNKILVSQNQQYIKWAIYNNPAFVLGMKSFLKLSIFETNAIYHINKLKGIKSHYYYYYIFRKKYLIKLYI